MADGNLLMIFRSMSTEDLQALYDKLIAGLTTLSSQTVGQKSLTRDLSRYENQLAAITFVLNERGSGIPGGYVGTMITDFSAVDSGSGHAPPPGTVTPM